MDAPSGPGNRSWVSITVVTTTLSMAFTAVCLRFYTRGFLIKQLGMDDYAMLVALVSVLLDMFETSWLIFHQFFAIACGIAITTSTSRRQSR